MSDISKIQLEDKFYDLPVVKGTEDEKAVDITKLRSASGWITLDSGYMNTGACTSEITFLNGEEGILRYRGYPIEELAEKSNFLEVSYLLIYGHLPTSTELDLFSNRIKSYGQIPDKIKDMMKSFPRDAHPMGVLSSMMVALTSFYPQYLVSDLKAEQKEEIIPLLLCHTLVLATSFYRSSQGLPSLEFRQDLNFSENFYHLMFSHDTNGKVSPELTQALDVLFVLHGDHEQNCSTSTVRLVGSSKANLFASVAAGVNALWGPSHGGANQAVIEMLHLIHKDGGGYKKFLNKVKDKKDNARLMGFGHRVYKNFDPRAKIIKSICDNVLKTLGIQDPVLDIAKGLEEEALKDSYFIERKLYPNVDFYSGIIYKAMGIPTNMFTVMFALGRLPGWLAQWKEMVESPMKIGRPRQIYMGERMRHYLPMNER